MSILDCDSVTEVLLVQPLHGEAVEKRIFQPGVELPFSLACLSAYLQREGVSSEIFDWRIYKQPKDLFLKVLRSLKPMVVGVTAVTAGIDNAGEVAKIVKEFDGKTFTVIGGCHASALPEETLFNYPQFDYLIHGEGEASFLNLIKSLEDGDNPKELKGLAYRENGKVRINPKEDLFSNLDELPFPARDKLELDKYAPNAGTRNSLRSPSTGLSVGRGCPYSCFFCYKGVWGKGIRFRSPANVVAEIEECIKNYGIYDFRFYDDVLTFPRWDLKEFCGQLIKKGVDISWNCWSRVNTVDYERLVLMKKAGCYHIKYGIEFGTEKALKLSKKGATLEQARRAINLTKDAGIECKGSFIFGIPGETIEDCKKTLKFALELSPDFATFYAFDLVPGSKFYEFINESPGNEEYKMLPRKITEKISSQAYRAFYFRPAFILQRIKAIITNPRKEMGVVSNGLKMMLKFFIRERAVQIKSIFYPRRSGIG